VSHPSLRPYAWARIGSAPDAHPLGTVATQACTAWPPKNPDPNPGRPANLTLHRSHRPAKWWRFFAETSAGYVFPVKFHCNAAAPDRPPRWEGLPALPLALTVPPPFCFGRFIVQPPASNLNISRKLVWPTVEANTRGFFAFYVVRPTTCRRIRKEWGSCKRTSRKAQSASTIHLPCG